MNYLAHVWVLPARQPELALGAALPDLVRAFDRTLPRVERAVADRVESAGARDLARGIRAHQAADASFHALAGFRAACDELKAVARAVTEAGGRVRGFFLAHVLLEMLLDASLLEHDPALAETFQAALAPELVRDAAARLRLPEQPFEDFVGRFRAARVVESYLTDRGVARRLAQVLARARQPLPLEAEVALAGSVGAFRESVRNRVASLTLEPRARVAALFG